MTISPEEQESFEANIQYQTTALSIGQNLPYIRWALSHASEVSDLLEAIGEAAKAETLDAKWAHIKNGGDILVLIINDFPRNDSNKLMLASDDSGLFPECTVADVQELSARFDGSLIKNIVANLPAILEFIKAIIPLFSIV